MKRIGLALSGGGHRASLYHLGVVRFLRDAGLLSKVTHITSVSGGSILAAHLALNWDRCNGSASEFDAMAREFLDFVRLDIRNRILRRFPLMYPLRLPRRLLGYSNRQLTRTGLLEYHYQNYLYGDVSLFQLPERPQLHILSTNLSEGCLCSFNRNGLLMMRRQPGHLFRMERVQIGLATVAMAVTASSAFPGFFPPLELTNIDVGALGDVFGRHAYTDGAVFDNLGVRMFRCLERPLLMDSPLVRNDFLDFPAIVGALGRVAQSSEATPLRRLVQILAESQSGPSPLPLPGAGASGPQIPDGADAGEALVLPFLTDIVQHYQLHHEQSFAGIIPADPDACALLQVSRRRGHVLDPGDQCWLNRHLLEAAFRQATGQACFRRLNSGLDGVLVSDVGKPIKMLGSGRAGGLIRTALRATDILIDRVWQLEKETFQDTPGFVFAPITEVVEPTQDPTAPHPEIQRQTAKMRTDLDGFSPLEISSLVKHGYCVARKTCRSHPEVFGGDLPANPPWDPLAATSAPTQSVPHVEPGGSPAPVTVETRQLQASATRRIWSRLLDRRDWISYVYVPLIVPILVLLPYLTVKYYERSHWMNKLVESLHENSYDFEVMSGLLKGKPSPWIGEPIQDAQKLNDPDQKSFEHLQDSHILDLRDWKPTKSGDAGGSVYGYRRLKVAKKAEERGNHEFRVDLLASSPKTAVRFPSQQMPAKLYMSSLESPSPDQKKCRWQAGYDLQHLPAGDLVDLLYEFRSPGQFLQRGENGTVISFPIRVDTAELTTWILMPEGYEYRSWRLIRYEMGKPEKVEPVKIVTEYLATDYTILAFKLLSLKAGYMYELSWNYK